MIFVVAMTTSNGTATEQKTKQAREVYRGQALRYLPGTCVRVARSGRNREAITGKERVVRDGECIGMYDKAMLGQIPANNGGIVMGHFQ